MKILQKILHRWVSKKITLQKIEKYCLQLSVIRSKNLENINLEKIKVSCVQRTITPVQCIEEFIDLLHSFIKQAAEDGSQLVIFPEYNFFDLLGMIPGFKLINRYLTRKARSLTTTQTAQEGDTRPEMASPVWVFKAITDSIERGMEAIFAYFAQGYGIYIYTGSYLTIQDSDIYNVGALYGPEGEQIGKQKKLHLTKLESSFAMGRGDEIRVYDLPIGKISFPICMDATYFETFRILSEMGADIVILPIANPEEYNPWKALKGIWPRVQESYILGLKSSLNGWLVGMHYTGRSGIFAPISLTPNKDGILKIACDCEGNHLVTEEVNIVQLREIRLQAEYFGDRNFEFERDYVNRVY